MLLIILFSFFLCIYAKDLIKKMLLLIIQPQEKPSFYAQKMREIQIKWVEMPSPPPMRTDL